MPLCTKTINLGYQMKIDIYADIDLQEWLEET